MDATAAFDDIGHSDVAHDLMEEYRVGNLGTAEKAAAAAARKPRSPITQRSTCSSLTTW
jgi:cytochrome b involved in lipid metabolism